MAAPVQQCTVCGTENDIIRLTCTNCGAVLHERVATLNLFETALNILVEPRETFIRIARSEQRNYVLFLFALAGVLPYTVFLALVGASDLGIHLGLIILSYIIGAPLFGIVLFMLSAAIAFNIAPLDLKTRRWRVHLGVYAWGMVPVAFSAPVIAVLSFAIFGDYLFSLGYPAVEYKPEIFYVLAAIIAAALAVSVILVRTGFNALGMPGGKALLQAVSLLVSLTIFTIGIIAAANSFIRLAEIPL